MSSQPDYEYFVRVMGDSYKKMSNMMAVDIYNSGKVMEWTTPRLRPMDGRPEWMRIAYDRMTAMGVSLEATLRVLHKMELSKSKNRIIHTAAQRRKIMYKRGRSRMPWEK